MDFVTVGIIVVAGWVSLLVAVVAMCRAAASGDASRISAAEHARATSAPRSERAPRFDQPALS
jgi:hypothetical protein